MSENATTRQTKRRRTRSQDEALERINAARRHPDGVCSRKIRIAEDETLLDELERAFSTRERGELIREALEARRRARRAAGASSEARALTD